MRARQYAYTICRSRFSHCLRQPSPSDSCSRRSCIRLRLGRCSVAALAVEACVSINPTLMVVLRGPCAVVLPQAAAQNCSLVQCASQKSGPASGPVRSGQVRSGQSGRVRSIGPNALAATLPVVTAPSKTGRIDQLWVLGPSWLIISRLVRAAKEPEPNADLPRLGNQLAHRLLQAERPGGSPLRAAKRHSICIVKSAGDDRSVQN